MLFDRFCGSTSLMKCLLSQQRPRHVSMVVRLLFSRLRTLVRSSNGCNAWQRLIQHAGLEQQTAYGCFSQDQADTATDNHTARRSAFNHPPLLSCPDAPSLPSASVCPEFFQEEGPAYKLRRHPRTYLCPGFSSGLLSDRTIWTSPFSCPLLSPPQRNPRLAILPCLYALPPRIPRIPTNTEKHSDKVWTRPDSRGKLPDQGLAPHQPCRPPVASHHLTMYMCVGPCAFSSPLLRPGQGSFPALICMGLPAATPAGRCACHGVVAHVHTANSLPSSCTGKRGLKTRKEFRVVVALRRTPARDGPPATRWIVDGSL